LFNYQCPNGFPPGQCTHAPQLILNVVRYFQNKQQLHKENAAIQTKASLEQKSNISEGAQYKQKQRRRC